MSKTSAVMTKKRIQGNMNLTEEPAIRLRQVIDARSVCRSTKFSWWAFGNKNFEWPEFPDQGPTLSSILGARWTTNILFQLPLGVPAELQKETQAQGNGFGLDYTGDGVAHVVHATIRMDRKFLSQGAAERIRGV